MKRHGRAAAVGMTKLFVGAALADFPEAEGLEKSNEFPRLEDGNVAHDQAT
jgi:hypothetical protein